MLLITEGTTAIALSRVVMVFNWEEDSISRILVQGIQFSNFCRILIAVSSYRI